MGGGVLVTNPPQTGGGLMAPDPGMINFNPIGYNPINYKGSGRYRPIGYNPMETAPYNFVDPLQAAYRYNQFNLGAEQNAFQTGMQRGQQLTDLDTQSIMGFANQMSGLQQQLIGSENRFNQAQRLQAVDFAMPDLRSSLDRKKQRGETYASGRLLSSAEDRAYEVAARSASADGSFTRGFGDDSVFGKRTSDVLSAQQRLGISQMGEGLLNDWISQGSSILIDSPLKSSISQRLPSTPQILPSQQAAQQQQNLTNLTTVPLQFGISSEINQEQFGTNLEQSTRSFNTSNEFAKDQFNKSGQMQNRQFNTANRFAKDQFNASNQLAADQFNASGMFQASQAQFGGYQSNFQLATQAANRAEDIQRQDAHNQAASVAADANIGAQQSAANVGAAGQIGGAIISGITSYASGGASTAVPVPGAKGLVTGGQSLQAVAGTSGAKSLQLSAPQASQQVEQGASQVVQQAPQMTPSGAPMSYQGASIPVSSSPTDRGVSAVDIAQGYTAAGGLISSIGQSGPSTPQMTALGQGLAKGGAAAGAIVGAFQGVATPQAKTMLATQLHEAALGNAGSPETAETVNQIFSQVREHLDTGVPVKGQAAGIAGFIQNYNEYNGPEKARAITNISFAGQDLENNFGVKSLDSDALGQSSIPGTGNKMTMQDALSLANSGYNVSSLVSNWDDITEVHSVLNENDNVLNVAATARNLGLLDSDTPETIRNKQFTLRSAGAQPAGAWGAGAVAFPANSRAQVESLGMAVVGKTNDGQSIAIPMASAASTGMSNGIVGSGVDERGLRNIAPQTLPIGAGAARVYNNWSTDYIARSQGQMGGAPAVANGLYKLGGTDPFLFGNVLLGGLNKNTEAGRPSEEFKGVAKDLGLVEDDFDSDAEIFKVDTAKDTPSVMNLTGQALSMLVYGSGDDPSVKSMGNYFTNQIASDSELTKEGFGKAQTVAQGAFKQVGIQTKPEAYALSNQLLYEGRISQVQAVQIQQGINLAFDKEGFQAANQLLEGVRMGKRK